MNGSLFQQLQAIVRQHMWLLLPGMALTCGGCISCRGGSNISHMHAFSVQLSSAQQTALLPYTAPAAHIPAERCVELCKSPSAPVHKPITSCSFDSRGLELARKSDEPVPNEIHCQYTVVETMAAGRRPAGLLPGQARASSPTADWFAQSARLEAAAVIAFAELHDELGRLAAPPALRDACRMAIADERRHASLMKRLAEEAGCDPAPPIVLFTPPRSRLALACENAVEGCLREPFGALEALWQSQAAADPAVRAAMAQIAEDEARHAELAFAIAAWLQERLTPAERRHVRRVQSAAYKTLMRDLGTRPTTASALGLPGAAQAQSMFHVLMVRREVIIMQPAFGNQILEYT